MPDLLLELFSEEIPARMQRKAADDLRKLVTDALVEAGLVYEGARAFATPRRLALTVHGLPARSPDRREERKGPRVGAPEKAIEGFLKAAGLASITEAKVQEDRKGDFYVAVTDKPGRPAAEVIAEIVPAVIRGFPWPKSMRWGAASVKPGSLSWVRPLHSILCVFGPETEETDVVEFAVDGIAAGRTTRGHRFMAPAPFTVRRFDDYVAKLDKAKVVLDADRRRQMILADARDRALALGLELVEDEALLDEVAGLVEWPVVLAGTFEEAFLAIPPEVIRTTIRVNQKCFVLSERAPHPPLKGEGGREAAGRGHGGVGGGTPTRPAAPTDLSLSGGGEERPVPRLSNRFIMVANIEAADGGTAIVEGNARVIRARLADARHFFDTDRRDLPDHDTAAMRQAAEQLGLDLKKPLDQRMAKLASTGVIFHEKLGTQGERVERIARLAEEIADVLSAHPGFFAGRTLSGEELAREQAAFRKDVRRAAVLAKADLTSEMVGEFPELQGLMGKYYALAQGEDASVAAAVEEHYKPVGPSDRVPADPVSVAVALADKLDLLVGFWAIDEKPTGSKDPYALRRAALGAIRIVLENGLRVALLQVLSRFLYDRTSVVYGAEVRQPTGFAVTAHLYWFGTSTAVAMFEEVKDRTPDDESIRAFGLRSHEQFAVDVPSDLLAFFADRLKVQLREQGARHDLVDAVFALGQGAHPPLEGEGRAAGAGWGEEKKVTPTRSTASTDLPPPGGGGAPGPQDDLVLIVRRVEALGRFLDTEDGRNLLAGYRRAANILREEERKTGERYDGPVDPGLLSEPEEKALFEAIGAASGEARAAVALEDFDGAMRALAKLRAPVDAFFDKVLVNAPDKAVRANRLRLLDRIRQATLTVADFSKVEG